MPKSPHESVKRRNAKIHRRLMRGETAMAISRDYGFTPQHVRLIGRKLGFSQRHKDQHRNVEISRRLMGMESLEAIAKDYGLTRERVRQIGKELGLPGKRIAISARAKVRRDAEAARRQAKIDRDQKLLAELRALVEQGLSLNRAVDMVADRYPLSISMIKLKAEHAGIGAMSLFGRWPANAARRQAASLIRVPMPSHPARARKQDSEEQQYDAAIRYFIHPDGVVSFR